MNKMLLVVVVACTSTVVPAEGAEGPTVSVLGARYANNQDRATSCVLSTEFRATYSSASHGGQRTEAYYIAYDAERVSIRLHSWADVYRAGEPLAQQKANYNSRSWDGKRLINYIRGGDKSKDLGRAYVTPDAPDAQVRDVRSNSGFLPFAGFYHPGVYERIDVVVRHARSAALRAEREQVNGVRCWVIDAAAETGDYTVWLDPEHGYNAARVRVKVSAAAGHKRFGRPLRNEEATYTTTNLRFESFDRVWLPVESEFVSESTGASLPWRKEQTHVVVKEAILNPDHEKLRSFAHDDIPNGAAIRKYPILQIGYAWQDGDLIPKFDKEVVAKIDQTLGTMGAREDVGPETDAGPDVNTPGAAAQPEVGASRGLRPHCGLYCLYSLLRLAGREVSYENLVKPEYYGSREGSSLADLHRLAGEYGLQSEAVRRLSTHALRDAPCQAVLHVRADDETRQHNHYVLFLGTENGKAKLFNPPEEPRLVSFRELAGLWDGNALLVSSEPLDTDAVCAADRQRLLLCWTSGLLVCLALLVGRLVWSGFVGAIPRRRLLRWTVGQGAGLAVCAFGAGLAYHLIDGEGLLTNAPATASIQKAYQGAFIPRISKNKVRGLLYRDVVFIDARLTTDYEAGHLDHALSLPVDANDALWKKTTASVPRDKPMVVYCQSAGCKFAEKVGVRLLRDGFTGISIYRGGWNDWTRGIAVSPDRTQ
jgi:rhodanese-related sulfurtransferase